MSEEIMTPDEFAAKMRELNDSLAGDPEALHGEADKLMCAVLRGLAYGEGVAIFETMDIWYA